MYGVRVVAVGRDVRWWGKPKRRGVGRGGKGYILCSEERHTLQAKVRVTRGGWWDKQKI